MHLLPLLLFLLAIPCIPADGLREGVVWRGLGGLVAIVALVAALVVAPPLLLSQRSIGVGGGGAGAVGIGGVHDGGRGRGGGSFAGEVVIEAKDGGIKLFGQLQVHSAFTTSAGGALHTPGISPFPIPATAL